jgi:hypothetical protein
MAAPKRRPALVKAPTGAHPLAPARSTGPADPAPAASPAQAVMLSARIPAELRDRLKVHAARSRPSVQEIVLAALEDYLARHPL